jgi:hypothetical protein
MDLMRRRDQRACIRRRKGTIGLGLSEEIRMAAQGWGLWIRSKEGKRSVLLPYSLDTLSTPLTLCK